MDFRKTYDAIPEQFDRWRPRYCKELFDTVIARAGINESSRVLEIGPGTGQATEPFLQTGCNYTAVELGENFTGFMRDKFGHYPNFHIINGDFETVGLESGSCDLIFSAATIQWIPERIAFTRSNKLLRDGGTLAMFMTRTDERSANPELKNDIEEVYRRHFRVDTKYTCRLDYNNAVNYGFGEVKYLDWKRTRVLTADEYADYLAATQVEHITLKEPYRTRFFDGVREAVNSAGNRITLIDTIALYITEKGAAK